MENPWKEALTHVENISKKKPTVKWLLAHIYGLRANNFSNNDLQDQKATPNHTVVTESLKQKLVYLKNENLTKNQIIKTIIENQYLPSALLTQS